jgi:hypothetical protein
MSMRTIRSPLMVNRPRHPRPPAGSPDQPDGPAHERHLGALGPPEEEAGHRRRPDVLHRRTGFDGGGVGPQHDVGVENGDQGVEVTAA